MNDEERYIYSAFLDRRFNTPYLRMFGMQNRNVTSGLYCRFDYGTGKVDFPPERSYAVYPQWPSEKLKYHAYYYGCAIPDFLQLSANVTFSVFVQGSRSQTNIEVTEIGRVPNGDRKELAVCVKAFWGKVDPFRLVEWIEVNRAMGVDKFVIYDRTVVGASARILEYYAKLGLVEIIPFTYVLSMGYLMEDDPMRWRLAHEDFILEQAYLVSINDCYYRFRDQYKYIMVIDLDEVIVPTMNESLVTLIERSNHEFPLASAFTFPIAWHFEQFGEIENSRAPKYMYMQRYLRRTPIMMSQPKTIFHTDRAVSLNWHGVVMIPSKRGYVGNVNMPWKKYGVVHHYRQKCKYDESKCAVMLQMAEVDDVMPRYLGIVDRQIESVLKENGIL